MSEEKDEKDIEALVEKQAAGEEVAGEETEEAAGEGELDERKSKATGSRKWIFS